MLQMAGIFATQNDSGNIRNQERAANCIHKVQHTSGARHPEGDVVFVTYRPEK